MYSRLIPTELACADPGTTQTLSPRGELLVVNKLAGTIEFFRADSAARLATVPMKKFPHEVLLAQDGQHAYVSIYGLGVFGRNFEHPGDEVAIIDLLAREQVGAISTLPYKAPHGMAFDAQGTLWVSCDVSGMILAIDTGTLEILKAIPTGSHGSHWIAITPNGHKLYANNKTFPNLVVIDTASREVIRQIPLAPGSEGIALDPKGRRLYVAAQRPQQFYVIDTTSDEMVATVPITVFDPVEAGKNPQKRIQVAPDGKRLVISSFATGEIAIVDTADLSRQRRLVVENGPMGITFDGPSRAYVMNHDQGSIMQIDLDTATVLRRFETGAGPETMAMF